MPKAMVLTKTGSTDYLEMRDYPEPKADPGTVVADVSLCGVCGTDTHMVYGRLPVPMPHILGHEWFGTVKELGKGVETDYTGKPLEEGDHICCCLGTCGKCWFCHNTPGRESLCMNMEVVGISGHSCDEPPHFWGAFAERVYLQPQMPIFKFPKGVFTEKEMVLVEPMAVATRAFKRMQSGGTDSAAFGEGIDPSQTLVIQGAGPIGLCHTVTANVYGMNNIVVIDSIPARLEQAKKMGATATIDMNDYPTTDDRVEAILDLTYGIGADGVMEATGVPAAFSEAFKLVRRGGTVVEMGHFTNTGETKINPHVDFCNKEVDCFGDWGYSRFEYRTAIAVMEKAKKIGVKFEGICTDVQPLSDLPNQILRQEQRKAPGKIAIDCRIVN
ncbi:MAG TPA: zinc-binding dehydrogenase [Methanomassiliicoccales archaeon]|nr:zinc-binding dehydrogenase [Methanomassiliicoccales archaeon]